MKTTVIYHKADYDGIFCREIARKFLPDAELIGWDFGDRAIEIPNDHLVYVLDLPLDKPLGLVFMPEGSGAVFNSKNFIWIDHHKSSIESHPKDIPGYRIDGVAACRLAWQWFTENAIAERTGEAPRLPEKRQFIERIISEPLAVRLAGEYDVWDHRGDGDLEFQFGLDSEDNTRWDWFFSPTSSSIYASRLVAQGKFAMACYAKRDADIVRSRSFLMDWEGLKFLCLNTAQCNSNTFSALDKPETGHDALAGFYYDGKMFTVSLYHSRHRTDIDLSAIAVRYGGGGHRGACGFRFVGIPFRT